MQQNMAQPAPIGQGLHVPLIPPASEVRLLKHFQQGDREMLQ